MVYGKSMKVLKRLWVNGYMRYWNGCIIVKIWEGAILHLTVFAKSMMHTGQIGGMIMLAIGTPAYLVAGLWLTARALTPEEARLIQELIVEFCGLSHGLDSTAGCAFPIP